MSNTTEVEKKCTCCGQWKNTDLFSPDKRGVAGVHGWCKDCNSEKARKRRAKVKAEGGYPVKKGPKTCSKCGVKYEKGEEAFSVSKAEVDGLCGYCKSCRATSGVEYRAENTLRAAVNNANHTARTKHNDDNRLVLEDVEAKFDEMGNTCVFCETADKVGIDHDIPFAQGGLNILENVQPCCKSCNSSKHDKTSEEYRKTFKGDK